MHVSLQCRPHQLPGGAGRLLIDVARLADEAGLYGLHIGEHVVMGGHTDAYPYGEFQHQPETPWFDAIAALAAVAAVTHRLRLSTGVLLTALRAPALLAKSLATVDVLASGRLEPGIGIGWQREEYDAVGADWEHRYSLFYDGIRACRALWTGHATDYTSKHTDLQGIVCQPTPVQLRLPLLFGVAVTPKSAPRIAELGDGWCPFGLGLDAIHAGVEQLRAAFIDAGRSPDELIVRVSAQRVLTAAGRIDIARSVDQFAQIAAAGATIVSVGPPQAMDTMSEVAGFVQELADATRKA
jgi:probable F420-dependent oxidoreductase